MLSALLILMTGFVGGVAVTVTLGVGLYFMVTREEDDDAKDWSPPSPMKAPASPEAVTRTDYGAFAPYGAFTPRPTPPPPIPRASSVDLDDWRY
ncbi:hypothetical protein [Brevundimonas sp. BAL3]|uniref:hypothetical protein n=1 Tax=Brevundimonas sp. BAL3 TaxID=391600 RepID=UPI00058D6672|nr:hypothetical protein [Brevundimonas sp. BAL3]